MKHGDSIPADQGFEMLAGKSRVLSFEHIDAEYHLIMEFLGRGSLANRLAEDGIRSVAETLAIARDVLDALTRTASCTAT